MLQKLSKCEVWLDFIEIWPFYRHSDFTWNPILVKWNCLKMSFLAILEVLNFVFSKSEQLSSHKSTKFQSLESVKLQKMTFLDCLNLPIFDIMQNLSGSKMIKYQQSQALTSHFESFWSIVHYYVSKENFFFLTVVLLL